MYLSSAAGGVTIYKGGVWWRNQELVLECIKFATPVCTSKWFYPVDSWVGKYRALGRVCVNEELWE